MQRVRIRTRITTEPELQAKLPTASPDKGLRPGVKERRSGRKKRKKRKRSIVAITVKTEGGSKRHARCGSRRRSCGHSRWALEPGARWRGGQRSAGSRIGGATALRATVAQRRKAKRQTGRRRRTTKEDDEGGRQRRRAKEGDEGG